MRLILMCLTCLLVVRVDAQYTHLDFIGAGHDNEITVTTSSNGSGTTGEATVDGFSITNQAQLKDASRFLAQATFGADYATIQMVAAMGYEAWLQEQFALPAISIVDEMQRASIYAKGEEEEEEEEEEDGEEDEEDREEEDDKDREEQEEEEEEEEFLPINSYYFDLAWMNNHLTSPDALRQRMSFALSQIMVVNRNGDFFEDTGLMGGNYYDMLNGNSFGNYQTLLTDVTLNMNMGLFLSHYNNRKADPTANTRPDENYAREIMQLFSIGLWELNPDGTRRYDSNGQFIPSYTNEDIKEFAKVFTGLGHPMIDGFNEPFSAEFFAQIASGLPMKMYDEYHETSEKRLLNGVVLPAGQSGMQDISQTIDHLANHANTAPFICKQLIQRFTTSNPSAAYVMDVASVFDPGAPNNFQDVISAILLHPEARQCTPTEQYTFGKLREPLVRVMNMLKSFQVAAYDNGSFHTFMGCLQNTLGQFPLRAPSVFNFYRPDYAPQGVISQRYMVGPEFQIFNSTNAIGIVNDVQNRTIFGPFLGLFCLFEDEVFDEEEVYYAFDEDNPDWFMEFQDYSDIVPLLNRPEDLVSYLNIVAANGMLQDDTKSIIANAIRQLPTPQEKLRMALYLVYISPDYAILK